MPTAQTFWKRRTVKNVTSFNKQKFNRTLYQLRVVFCDRASSWPKKHLRCRGPNLLHSCFVASSTLSLSLAPSTSRGSSMRFERPSYCYRSRSPAGILFVINGDAPTCFAPSWNCFRDPCSNRCSCCLREAISTFMTVTMSLGTTVSYARNCPVPPWRAKKVLELS